MFGSKEWEGPWQTKRSMASGASPSEIGISAGLSRVGCSRSFPYRETGPNLVYR